MNAQQYELIKSLLPKKNPNLFMVGDTDQVFDKKFPIIKLQKSYRCPTNVLKIAAQIIEKNEFLEGHNFSEKPEIIECENADCEAEFIAKKIKKLALTNVAIICPTSEIVEKFKKYSCKSVSVMTMNESKGLEFDCVFIPACEILEERLFYIAITRTKKYLFLSYAKKRFFNHRLVTLNKSSILDLFEQNLIKASKAKIKPSKKQIEFAF
jgi:superfamily I DNA/RNA helicase